MKISERKSQFIFKLELIFLVIPTISVFVFYSCALSMWSVLVMKDFVDLVLTQRIFNSGLNFLTDVLQRVALDVLGLALGMSLWAALANFGALSNLFRKEGAAGLRGKESVFQAGLVFGLLPLALLAWLAIKAGVSHVLMVYGSGLTLIPPIFHVWLEIKCRGPTEDTA